MFPSPTDNPIELSDPVVDTSSLPKSMPSPSFTASMVVPEKLSPPRVELFGAVMSFPNTTFSLPTLVSKAWYWSAFVSSTLREFCCPTARRMSKSLASDAFWIASREIVPTASMLLLETLKLSVKPSVSVPAVQLRIAVPSLPLTIESRFASPSAPAPVSDLKVTPPELE